MQGGMWILADQRGSMAQRRLWSSALVLCNRTFSPHFHNKGLGSNIAFMHIPQFGFTYSHNRHLNVFSVILYTHCSHILCEGCTAEDFAKFKTNFW